MTDKNKRTISFILSDGTPILNCENCGSQAVIRYYSGEVEISCVDGYHTVLEPSLSAAIKRWNQGTDDNKLFDVETCVLCGCTDENACKDGCFWVAPCLCSQCAEKMEALGGELEILTEDPFKVPDKDGDR